jgi:cyclic beta-1,2-glucan synthetase
MQNTAPATSQADPLKQNIPLAQIDSDEAIVALAKKLADCKPQHTSFTIPARLKQFTEFFQKCYEYFDEASKAQVSTSQTAEWLLDNYYVVEQAIRQIQEDLPADYYQRLPKTQEGWVRIYIVALANAQREDTRLDIEQLKHFLQVFQDITPLSTGELWALPLMLRLAVLEFLAEALAEVTKLKWDAPSTGLRTSMPGPEFWGDIETSTPPIPDVIVANSILNLRRLATQDWKAFFESTSILEKILRNDPAGVYSEMDFETRNHYRNVIEQLARGSEMDEAGIARKVIQLSQTAAEAAVDNY